MIRYAYKNISGSVRSRYFLMGILLMVGLFFFSTGRGNLSIQRQEKPLLIQEIFRYPAERYESQIDLYNSAAMFEYGMGNYMYLVMPLTGIGFLLRFCDERHGGYDKMILARIGKKRYLLGTLLSAAALSTLTVFCSGLIILSVLYAALPPASKAIERYGPQMLQSMMDSDIIYGNGILFCLKLMFFGAVLAVTGNVMGFFIAAVSESKFVSLTAPVLIFEIWTEICGGSTNYFWNRLSLRSLFNPITNGISASEYSLMAVSAVVLLGSGFYITALKKFEKGW